MKQNIEDNIFQEIFTSLINFLLNKRGFKVKYNKILESKYILCIQINHLIFQTDALNLIRTTVSYLNFRFYSYNFTI